jgi:hypothetical protein
MYVDDDKMCSAGLDASCIDALEGDDDDDTCNDGYERVACAH